MLNILHINLISNFEKVGDVVCYDSMIWSYIKTINAFEHVSLITSECSFSNASVAAASAMFQKKAMPLLPFFCGALSENFEYELTEIALLAYTAQEQFSRLQKKHLILLRFLAVNFS